MSSVSLNSRRIDVPDSFQAIQDYCWEQGWTDGLPVVPPTEPLVREMLASYGGDPSFSLGIIQPRNAQATLEKLAINAVMAGCKPEYFPVVVAGVKAALDKDFNLGGNAATTGGAAQVMIINGPIAAELDINGDAACFGPGAACTTREVVGVGVPQVTATLQCAAAREDYFRRTGRYVSIITDGGFRTGGDVCKAMVSGADGVMLGTPFAQANEAPGRGFNWGMANPHPELPRGTRISVGTKGSLKEILYGPTSKTDGTQNFMGALKVAMGMVGAYTLRDLHKAEMVIAPSIKTEGKFFQMSR